VFRVVAQQIIHYPWIMDNYEGLNKSEKSRLLCSDEEGDRKMAKGDDIEARLVGFAVSVLEVCERLPKSPEGSHVAGQLLRSGTSGAPNYAESRAAESAVDFIHKLGIVLKELNESRVWLEMILKRQLVVPKEVQPVLEECVALSKIIAASRRTAAANAGRMRKA
jgi:four helix bundle protein